MRIALCFYGLVGSKTDKNGTGIPLDPSIAHKLNYENIISHNISSGSEVDVFIHSWSHEHKDELVELYKPKLHVIEKQIDFPYSDNIAYNRDFTEKLLIVFELLKSPKKMMNLLEDKRKEAFRAYSRWYSNKAVLKLKSAYEQKKGFKYDAVMVLRLDVGFYSSVDFAELDMNNFYASHWNDYPTKGNDFTVNRENHNRGKGFLDFWFISNSNNMDLFSELYDSINNYHVCPHRSAYQHTATFTDNIEYIKYRWLDFEMIRRKEFNAEK